MNLSSLNLKTLHKPKSKQRKAPKGGKKGTLTLRNIMVVNSLGFLITLYILDRGLQKSLIQNCQQAHTKRNSKTYLFPLAKELRKGYPNTRKPFWQYLTYSNQMPTEKPHNPCLAVSKGPRRGVDLHFFAQWKQAMI